MKITTITDKHLSIEEIATLLQHAEEIQPVTLDQVNWPAEFPYKPKVSLRIARSNDELFLQYTVQEAQTMALVSQDNGEVWTDSCCEFFISFDEQGYYNLEVTAIGKALLGFRKTKPEAVHAPQEIMQLIRRHSTMGTEPFAEIKGDNKWTLTLAIPAKAFFRHEINSFDGVTARFNAYKCGDNLSVPHFVSLFPIDFPKPNFHLEEFFQEIEF